ncbi:translation initiation factor eIF2B subunit beta [Halyomorpha halys]|uniref:translation initiation factor eIF2B subunit beta n=1 Tax=Halyomorpha halys TaxID=286706 RepID=UPI0006D51882|nr:translation initiation factor eIF-2B subunit beta [Halyomorpha halys]
MIENKQFGLEDSVRNFILDVKYERIHNDIVIESVKLFKDIIVNCEWTTANDLLQIIKIQGKKITKNMPSHSSVGNIVRRILKIIREEYLSLLKNKQDESQEESLHKIVTSEGQSDDFNKNIPQLKLAIIDHLNEFETELEGIADNIAQQAREHIHSNEIIMTIGNSETVEAFLKKAAKDRKFEVIVAACSPSNQGHDLALNLAKNKIQTTLVPDSAVFGIMSRVNKVIIGTQTVMANGGLRAVCGTHPLALAAKHYSVPVIVLAPLYQLSPQYLCSYDQDSFNSFISPEGVLNYADGDILSKVHVYNPVYDYVPPEFVTLFISNTGGHAPSYVYRLLSELYHPDDYEL